MGVRCCEVGFGVAHLPSWADTMAADRTSPKRKSVVDVVVNFGLHVRIDAMFESLLGNF